MESDTHATVPENPVSGWALLVIPGLGILMTDLWSDFPMCDLPFLSALICQTNTNTWPPSDWRDVVVGIILATVVFLPLLVVSGGFVWLTNWVPLLQPIAEHVRRDWSLLSFLMYGAAFLPVMIEGDEYRGLGPYVLASLAILVGGALAYLRPAKPWPRLFTLLGALGLSLGLLAFGKYLHYPQQTWITDTRFPRWQEAISPFIPGSALALLMVAPAIPRLLPFGRRSPPAMVDREEQTRPTL